MSAETPPPFSGDVQRWAEELTDYLIRQQNILPYRDSDSRATRDGIFMWDPSINEVVVSYGGAWYRILKDTVVP